MVIHNEYARIQNKIKNDKPIVLIKYQMCEITNENNTIFYIYIYKINKTKKNYKKHYTPLKIYKVLFLSVLQKDLFSPTAILHCLCFEHLLGFLIVLPLQILGVLK